MSNRILVIDDEKNIRLTLKQALEAEGYEVVSAVNGEEGLEELRGGEFDVILVDMKMPGMSGLEFIEKARGMTQAAVVMITAYGTVETAVKAMKLGAVDFLSKPFSPESIRTLVRDILERRNLAEGDVRSYGTALAYAKRCINERRFPEAKRFLQQAISYEATKPEAFNLLGVLFELEGDFDSARKEYRAALALDPTYRPADDNLHRLVQSWGTFSGINLGDDEGRADADKR